jgi:TP901 family phage tail tape measure protein
VANYDLGTARGTIEINYNGDGIGQAQRGLQGLRGHAESSETAINKVGTTTGVAGTVIAAGILVAVNSAANFEQRLSAIAAVSGNTAQQMEQVRAKALQIGKDTSFSASEAASAMEELSKAGISTTDILNGAADATVALAAAGEVSLPEAASISSNAMNQFALSAQDLPRVADLIAGAANASAIDVKEFGYSLAQVGAVAHLAGLSFDDTAVAIAELGNAGVKGSDAGTSLKSMLSRLQPTTKAAARQMEALGLITKDGTNQFYDQTGKLKPLREIQGLLGDSLKGLSAQTKQAALQTLFGSDAIRAAAILAGNGAQGFDKLATSMGKVKAADVAKTRLDNMKGSLEGLKGSAETMAIQLGQVLLPAIRSLVDGINSALGVFLSLPDGVQKFIIIAATFIAITLLIVSAVIKAKLAFDALKVTMLALNGTFLANPIVLIIAAIIALVAAIIVAYKNSETFRNIVNAVWAAIKTAIGAVVDWFVNTAWPALKAAWDAIATAATTLWGWIKTAWDAIYNVVATIVGLIATVITTYIAIWTAIIQTGLNIIMGIWNAIWGTFGPLITAIWNLIVAIVQLAIAIIKLAIEVWLTAMQAIFTTVWSAIKTVVTTVWNAISAVIQTVINFLKPYISAALSAIQTTFTTIWNAIKTVVSTVVNAIKTTIETVWNAIKSVTATVWGAIDKTIGDKIRSVITTVKGVYSQVVGIFKNAGSWLLNAGKQIIQGLINGVTSMISTFTDKIRSLTNLIPQLKGPPAKDKVLLERNGELIMTGLINGIENMVGPLSSMLRGIGTSIPTQFTTSAVGMRASNVASQSALASIPRQTVYNTTVNNPLPEPAGESVNKRLQTLTMMGA